MLIFTPSFAFCQRPRTETMAKSLVVDDNEYARDYVLRISLAGDTRPIVV